MASIKNTLLICAIVILAAQIPAVSECRVTLPDGKTFKTEIADSQKERAIGLMEHKELPENQALLLVFEKPGFHSIWMKNMDFPIDIIWLDGDFKIVYFEENVKPCQKKPCPNYTPLKKARYVLEVPPNTVSQEGLTTGNRLSCDLKD